MPTSASDPSERTNPDISLSPESYYQIVGAAYDLVRRDDFDLESFASQGQKALIGMSGGLVLREGARAIEIQAGTQEALLQAVTMSEVLGARYTHALGNDRIKYIPIFKEDPPQFGLAEFNRELVSLGVENLVFFRTCIDMGQPYIDASIKADPNLDAESRVYAVMEGRECENELKMLINSARLELIEELF
jgi:hypothetical protein